MNPGIGIMTVPQRKELSNSLVKQLQNFGVKPYVSIDRELKGTWYNWKRTASIVKDSGHSHVLVLQDDVILCKNFYKEYLKVLKQQPEKPICLFTPYKLPNGMYSRNYVISAQGISIPSNLIDGLFNWVKNNHNPKWRFDDSRLNSWCKNTNNSFVYPVPTLIDHNTDIESTLGHEMKARGGPWKSINFKK